LFEETKDEARMKGIARSGFERSRNKRCEETEYFTYTLVQLA